MSKPVDPASTVAAMQAMAEAKDIKTIKLIGKIYLMGKVMERVDVNDTTQKSAKWYGAFVRTAAETMLAENPPAESV